MVAAIAGIWGVLSQFSMLLATTPFAIPVGDEIQVFPHDGQSHAETISMCPTRTGNEVRITALSSRDYLEFRLPAGAQFVRLSGPTETDSISACAIPTPVDLFQKPTANPTGMKLLREVPGFHYSLAFPPPSDTSSVARLLVTNNPWWSVTPATSDVRFALDFYWPNSIGSTSFTDSYMTLNLGDTSSVFIPLSPVRSSSLPVAETPQNLIVELPVSSNLIEPTLNADVSSNGGLTVIVLPVTQFDKRLLVSWRDERLVDFKNNLLLFGGIAVGVLGGLVATALWDVAKEIDRAA